MSNDSLEEKRRKMIDSQSKIGALIHSYRTEQGIVFRLPDLNDPSILQAHMVAMNDAISYFSAAKHLRHATTYRFENRTQNRIAAQDES